MDIAVLHRRCKVEALEVRQPLAVTTTELDKFLVGDRSDASNFSIAADIDGDIMAVGTPEENGAPFRAVYVYYRNQGGADAWGQVAKLTTADIAGGESFGVSLAISGDTIVVGAYGATGAQPLAGAAYVFQRDQGGPDAWGEVAKLTASDTNPGSRFGLAVDISGDTIVVGAKYVDGNAGAAYLFERNAGGANAWDQVDKVTASDDPGLLGNAVAISGDTLVVGAYVDSHGAYLAGAAYVYQRNSSNPNDWIEVDKLTAADAAAGDFFGETVAIDGGVIAVGAVGDDGPGSELGAAYVFEKSNPLDDSSWQQVKKLQPASLASNDRLGNWVSVAGDKVVVTALHDASDSSNHSGAAYVFARDRGGPNNWGQIAKLTTSDSTTGDAFLHAAISGDTVVVGGHKTPFGSFRRGEAIVFRVDDAPLHVVAETINAVQGDPADLPGGPQPTTWQSERSLLRTLVVEFNHSVTLAVGDLTLAYLGMDGEGNETLGLSASHISISGDALTITFDILTARDGVYRLTLGSTITDPDGQPLDGDNDGTVGDARDFVFHQLRSDFNGDGVVDIFDIPTITYWFFSSCPEYANLDNDPFVAVDIFDVGVLAASFFSAVTYPPGGSSLLMAPPGEPPPPEPAAVDRLLETSAAQGAWLLYAWACLEEDEAW